MSEGEAPAPAEPVAAVEEAKPEEEKFKLDPQYILEDDVSNLCELAQQGDYEGVKELIQRVPIMHRVAFVNQQDSKGFFPLHYCFNPHIANSKAADILPGQEKCARLLIEYGTDVNAADDLRNTALHHSCRLAHQRYIIMMIRAGANVYAENSSREFCNQVQQDERLKKICGAWVVEENTKYQDDVKAKTILPVKPEEISYFRSIYDILDTHVLDSLRFADIASLMEVESPEDETQTVLPEYKVLFRFFKKMDTDHDGTVSFPEFLHNCKIWMDEEEKAANKGKKKKKGGKKKKKKGGKKKKKKKG